MVYTWMDNQSGDASSKYHNGMTDTPPIKINNIVITQVFHSILGTCPFRKIGNFRIVSYKLGGDLYYFKFLTTLGRQTCNNTLVHW